MQDHLRWPFFQPQHRELAERIKGFVEREVEPRSREAEAGEAQAVQLVRLLGKEGLLKLVVPQAYGGHHPSVEARSLCLAREALAFSSSLADTMFAMQGLGSYPITLAGSEALKRRFLPRVASGEAIATIALTEPEAGSDIGSLQTRASAEGHGYVIQGTKRFISNAPIAHLISLFAKTDPSQGARGISAFVVEGGSPGLTATPVEIMAPHPIGELHFHGCRIPRENRLGEEGEGMKIALTTLVLFRTTVGAAALGLARRAFHEAREHARRRVQFGKPLAEFQAIQFYLADMAVEIDAAALLVYRAAWGLDQGDRCAMESSMAKLYATEAAQRIVDRALQIHGGLGVVKGTVVERLYREVRSLRIYEGTSEIQRLIIARELLSR